MRTVLHIFDWLFFFHYFLQLIFRLTLLTSAAKSNQKLVIYRYATLFLTWMPFRCIFICLDRDIKSLQSLSFVNIRLCNKSYIIRLLQWLFMHWFAMETPNWSTFCAKKKICVPYFLIKFPRKLFFFDFGLMYCLWPLITVNKCAETIQGQKLYEEIRYIFVNLR